MFPNYDAWKQQRQIYDIEATIINIWKGNVIYIDETKNIKSGKKFSFLFCSSNFRFWYVPFLIFAHARMFVCVCVWSPSIHPSIHFYSSNIVFLFFFVHFRLHLYCCIVFAGLDEKKTDIIWIGRLMTTIEYRKNKKIVDCLECREWRFVCVCCVCVCVCQCGWTVGFFLLLLLLLDDGRRFGLVAKKK